MEENRPLRHIDLRSVEEIADIPSPVEPAAVPEPNQFQQNVAATPEAQDADLDRWTTAVRVATTDAAAATAAAAAAAGLATAAAVTAATVADVLADMLAERRTRMFQVPPMPAPTNRLQDVTPALRTRSGKQRVADVTTALQTLGIQLSAEELTSLEDTMGVRSATAEDTMGVRSESTAEELRSTLGSAMPQFRDPAAYARYQAVRHLTGRGGTWRNNANP